MRKWSYEVASMNESEQKQIGQAWDVESVLTKRKDDDDDDRKLG